MSLNGTVWTPIGPSPMSEASTQDNGLVTAIAPHPYNQNIVYVGTAGGGVWRTRDGGTNWTPLFDRQLALGIGEPGGIAIDPNNTDILYVGSSQRLLFINVNVPTLFGPADPSQGMYKSQDGGASWIQLGTQFPPGNTGNAYATFRGAPINVIIVDPANSNTLYCATFKGVFTSTDGGQNWTLGANTAGGDARSLVLDPSSPANARVLYAGISGTGVVRSNDGGQTWNPFLNGTNAVVAAAIGAAPRGFGKVIVALPPPAAPPSPNGIQVIYVTFEGTGGAPDPVGLFLTTNQGTSWTQQAATAMPTGTQGGYSFHMAIDPASPGNGTSDIIYFGAVNQAVSTNSGTSFTAITGVHPDTHAWAFFPRPASPNSIAYVGCDGGISSSTNGGGVWTQLNSNGIQTSLFYNLDLSPDATASVAVGALQDNELETTATAATALGWVGAAGGGLPGFADGWDVAFDGQTAGVVYGSTGFWSPAPATRVFRSTNSGVLFPTNITPWTTATDVGAFVAPIATDPSTAGIVYVSGIQNLWQSQNATAAAPTWRNIGSFGGAGYVDVAPANGNNVVIAVGTQVFVSTNALAATVTFTNITRALPGRNVARAMFDPADPTIIYAVLGGFAGGGTPGHVFRTTIGGSAWTDLTPQVAPLTPPFVPPPNQPLDLPFNALALDGTTIPTTIYVGTDFGVLRSMDGGQSWSVLDDLHFPRAPVTDLVFNPTAGALAAATYGRGVFKFTKPVGPAIAVGPQDGLAFGTVCSGPNYLTLDVYNIGAADLVITNVQRLFGPTDFAVLPLPATPLTISPGEEVEFTVSFTPSSAGVSETAVIRITSNDPTAPVVDLAATGKKGTGTLASVIADTGNFGNVCVGSFADASIGLNNAGVCPLSISNITTTPAAFQAPSVASFPLVVAPGASIDIPVRFAPTSFGFQAGTVTVLSDDPASPRLIPVFGTAPPPRLVLALADFGDFGRCCVGSFRDEPLLISNSGKCALSVTAIASSSGEFLMPEVLAFPLVVGAGDALSVPIRFAPTSFGAKSATITVASDDPVGPRTIDVSGFAPSGTLAVTGSTTFGGVTACCCADRTISLCNVGDCDLHVTSVRFKRKSHHWKLLHNPFPTTLHSGSCLNVVIRYKATEKCPRSCELIIESDDPTTPVKIIEVLAYTIWDPCGCRACCEECRKGTCEKSHADPCCRQGYPCCCDDEDDDED
jgi:Abnormal spindle-like microcephaly-assoc'd, ASPM-SPD-2-Hydin